MSSKLWHEWYQHIYGRKQLRDKGFVKIISSILTLWGTLFASPKPGSTWVLLQGKVLCLQENSETIEENLQKSLHLLFSFVYLFVSKFWFKISGKPAIYAGFADWLEIKRSDPFLCFYHISILICRNLQALPAPVTAVRGVARMGSLEYIEFVTR